MKLYLVRHGETDLNRNNRMQGRYGLALNETGRRQVAILREKIRDIEFDACFSSPLERAKETAEILVGDRCDIILDSRLVERDFGAFEGKNADDFWQQIGQKDAFDRRINCSKEGLEPIRDVLARARSFLLDLKKDFTKDACILIVAHGSFLRTMHFEIIGYTDETNFQEIDFKNAELKVYDY